MPASGDNNERGFRIPRKDPIKERQAENRSVPGDEYLSLLQLQQGLKMLQLLQ